MVCSSMPVKISPSVQLYAPWVLSSCSVQPHVSQDMLSYLQEFCVTFEQPLVVVNIQNKFQPCFVSLEKKRLPNTITLTETKKKHDIGFSGAGEDCAALFSPPLSVPHGGAGLLALLPVRV